MRGHDHVQEKFGAIDQLSGWDMEFDIGGWFLEVVEWVHLKAVPRMVFAKLTYLLTERSATCDSLLQALRTQLRQMFTTS